jgi:hypothetical protein
MDTTGAEWAFVTSSPTAPTPTPGDSTTKLATTAFVGAAIDVAIGGLTWGTPIDSAPRVIGNASVATINGFAFTAADIGKTYIITDVGTITLGSILTVIGDVVEWDGDALWARTADGNGVGPADGTTVIGASTDDTLIAPWVGMELYTGVYDGASLTPTFTLDADGTARIDSAEGSVYENYGFVKDTTAWVNIFTDPIGDNNLITWGAGILNSGTASVPDVKVDFVSLPSLADAISGTDIIALGNDSVVDDPTQKSTVADLTTFIAGSIDLADLTDGDGIADFTYDGSGVATVAAELDGDSMGNGASGLKAAVPTAANPGTALSVTTGGGETTGVALAFKPAGDSTLYFIVNGIAYEIGLLSTDAFYIADPGSLATPLAQAAWDVADVVVQGSGLPFNLDTSDCGWVEGVAV